VIRGHPHSLADLVKQKADLARLPHIGSALAEKIQTLVKTGSLPALEKAKKRTPIALSALMQLPGLGPKRVRVLYHELGIRSLADLERAARRGRIRALPGFGIKTEAKILSALQASTGPERRFNRLEARELAEPLRRFLQRQAGVKRVTIAGSYRRCRDTVGDLDILVTARRGSPVVREFVAYDEVRDVVSQGTTRSTVRLRSGIQVDLRVVPEASYGSALYYFTGSRAHNIAVRRMALKRGLKINEYGVFKAERRVAGRTEESVFASVGLPWIPPELRENRGELAAAAEGKLPRLVQLNDIRGDFHCHTRASDGHNSIREMAETARDLGYEYLAISDHSRQVRVAHGLDPERLSQQLDDIDRLNDELRDIVILKSCEVDILKNGSLDLPDKLLARLDLTVCALHYDLHLPRKQQTERVLKAMQNRYFNILAHPTGRLINERPPCDLDMERILRAARDQGCYLEVNAQPLRLDLTDEACMLAREIGTGVAIGSDAHSADTLNFMQYGVDQARRGWLCAQDVLNTRSLQAVRSMLVR